MYSQIRNFCIIAHIDHGKSTLADRFIERVKLIPSRKFHSQILDSMEIEQERGITIKSQAVSLPYTWKDGQVFELNLIDTPGHVDFSYEVRRSIAASEGALLLVDAAQGIQAQTLSNFYLALDRDLTIIPVVNKIDLPAAEPERVARQIESTLGLKDVRYVSAKTGQGFEEILEDIIVKIPAPSGNKEGPVKAFVVDSHYDMYRGVVLHVRVYDGVLKVGDSFQLFSNKMIYTVEELGKFQVSLVPSKQLQGGEFGYIIANIKMISDVHVGDTIFPVGSVSSPVKGFGEVKPMVFSSIFPMDADDYPELLKAMEKLCLNDGALSFHKDHVTALGSGFRCGFLGLLHLEIIQERLDREFDMSVLLTTPSVRYEIQLKTGDTINVEAPQDFPSPERIAVSREPYIRATMVTPTDFLGAIMTLCSSRRAEQHNLHYMDEQRVEISYDLPLVEILFDFYDKLKSVSKGYASMDYEIIDYRPVELVKLDILINEMAVDSFSQLVWKGVVERRAREICQTLKEAIPRHQFKIPIQGRVGGKIVTRETIAAYRKDVTAKLYGGDVTRKKKLLEKQKKGKKRLRRFGSVAIPQSAFLSVMRSGS